MPSILNNFVKDNTDINDQVIANDLITGAKGAATAYLSATLECATPELKAMLSDGLNQILTGHAALTELAVKRNWYHPYDTPQQQLSQTLEISQKVINEKQK